MSTPKKENDMINLDGNINDGHFKREEKLKEKTPAFNQLLQLQLLIQKQAGLKELCKEKIKIVYNK